MNGMSMMPQMGMMPMGMMPGGMMQMMPMGMQQGMGMPSMMGMMPMGMMPNMMMPNMMMSGMGMMPMSMCTMTCEMGKDGMTCRISTTDAQAMEMLRQRCESMRQMMSMGAPCMIMCGGMPVVMATSATKTN